MFERSRPLILLTITAAMLVTPVAADPQESNPVDGGVIADPDGLSIGGYTCHAGPEGAFATIEVTGNNPWVAAWAAGEGPVGSSENYDEDSGAGSASASASVLGVFTESSAGVMWRFDGGPILSGGCTWRGI